MNNLSFPKNCTYLVENVCIKVPEFQDGRG
jgi:hypothetical protein